MYFIEFQVALDTCIATLNSYKLGQNNFNTVLENFEDDTKDDEFKGHKISKTNTRLAALKSIFVNKLIANINDR